MAGCVPLGTHPVRPCESHALATSQRAARGAAEAVALRPGSMAFLWTDSGEGQALNPSSLGGRRLRKVRPDTGVVGAAGRNHREGCTT